MSDVSGYAFTRVVVGALTRDPVLLRQTLDRLPYTDEGKNNPDPAGLRDIVIEAMNEGVDWVAVSVALTGQYLGPTSVTEARRPPAYLRQAAIASIMFNAFSTSNIGLGQLTDTAKRIAELVEAMLEEATS